MDYRVLVTDDAYEDPDNILYHRLFVVRNEQAAKSVLDDFEWTKEQLSHTAGSLGLCENIKLRSRGYRRMGSLFIRLTCKDAGEPDLFHKIKG